MPDERLQLKAIADLMALQPPRFLFGGWAEDALLHGKPSRPHEDIDLLVPLDELDDLLAQVAKLGFVDARVKFQVEDRKPIVVAVYADGQELELIIYQEDERGRGFFDLPIGDKLVRFWMPDDAFGHAPGRIGKIAVRTLSPLALYQIRDFCQHVFGGFRDKDRKTQAILKERYFRNRSESDLRPQNG